MGTEAKTVAKTRGQEGGVIWAVGRLSVRLSVSTSRHHCPEAAKGLPAAQEKFWKDPELSSCSSSLCEVVRVAWKQSKNSRHALEALGTSITTSPQPAGMLSFNSVQATPVKGRMAEPTRTSS